MTTFLYDGSWCGLLSAIFEVYERRIKEAFIVSELVAVRSLLGEEVEVVTQMENARRVWNGLRKRVSVNALLDLYKCYLSELPQIETVILRFVQFALKHEGAEKAFGNPWVLKVSQTAKIVHREKHRMEAFVRFKLSEDGIYYSIVDPDFNVLPLIADHFQNRYADQKWLIYDSRRKYGLFYNLVELEEIRMIDESRIIDTSGNFLNEDESLYQTLWKDYFKHVNIPERKNLKLHLQHVPKRYWKYLTEKDWNSDNTAL